MSENRIPNEQDLWDVLNEPVTAESKKTKPEPQAAPRPKTGPKFAKPEPPLESAPAPAKAGRPIDGFFFACMAGVAAVSVAATLVIGGMVGDKNPSATPVKDPAASTAPVEKDPAASTAPNEVVIGIDAAALQQENAELREQVELQKQQIKDLRAQLLDLTGSSGEISTGTTEPGQTEPQPDAQDQAYDLFLRIREAYDDFDRATLEELIPQMDKRLSYLSSDALNEYYLILEYVEQPSNG